MEMIERVQLQETADTFGNDATSYTWLDREREMAVACDEVEEHVAVVYCTVCASHLCQQCSQLTHNTR